jgi:SAM-dependent methyltransferase
MRRGPSVDDDLALAAELTCDGRVATRRLDAFRRLALDAALAEIAALLHGSGARPLLIKGPAFARWLYDDPRERSYNDIDLLVSSGDFQVARRGVAALGFEPVAVNSKRSDAHPRAYHEEWVRPGTLPLAVELHRALWGMTAAPPRVWKRMTEGARTVEVSGVLIDVPSEAASAFIVALHAADHLGTPRGRVYVNPGGRFAARDLHLALERLDIGTWQAAAAVAQDLGAAPLFAFGLRLDPAGRDVADRLGLSDRMPRRLHLRGTGTPIAAQSLESLIATPGVRARVMLLTRMVFPRPAFMRRHSGLARRGRLGLAGAYLWRPAQLMMMLPRVVRAWSRAAIRAPNATTPRLAPNRGDRQYKNAHLSFRNTPLAYKVRYAAAHPDRIRPYIARSPPYARRWARDRWLGMRADDHISYYRSIMRSDIKRGPEAAVGGRRSTRRTWLSTGQMQFDYLAAHGLVPSMRMLEVGCGNLRAGRLFIDYLDPGNYCGIDISPEILRAALDTLAKYDLQAKLPRLFLVDDLKLAFLPDHAFDVVHAHSVFSHSPLEVIDECLAHVERIMAPHGFFDFTFHATARSEHDVLREDFYYRPETLMRLAARHGLRARLMDDWERGRHPQSRLRVTRVTATRAT